jgi:hypothetical protein
VQGSSQWLYQACFQDALLAQINPHRHYKSASEIKSLSPWGKNQWGYILNCKCLRCLCRSSTSSNEQTLYYITFTKAFLGYSSSEMSVALFFKPDWKKVLNSGHIDTYFECDFFKFIKAAYRTLNFLTIVNNGSERKRSRCNVMNCYDNDMDVSAENHENIAVRMNGVQTEIRTDDITEIKPFIQLRTFHNHHDPAACNV